MVDLLESQGVQLRHEANLVEHSFVEGPEQCRGALKRKYLFGLKEFNDRTNPTQGFLVRLVVIDILGMGGCKKKIEIEVDRGMGGLNPTGNGVMGPISIVL